MAEFSEQDVGVLPPQDLERIYQLLKSKSIKDFWEVGSILDARFKKRAPYGHWPKIEAALRALGDDAPTSLAQLHQCRRLSATWSKEDLQAATHAGLPWGRAIVLISIWGKASKRNQPELIEQCKMLIASFPEQDRKTRKQWESKLSTLRKQSHSGYEFISKRRLLGEKKAAVILRLTAAAHMIEEMREFLPTKAHAACTTISAQANALTERVEKLFKKHTVSKPKSE